MNQHVDGGFNNLLERTTMIRDIVSELPQKDFKERNRLSLMRL